jgi:cystathionine gamma-lyase
MATTTDTSQTKASAKNGLDCKEYGLTTRASHSGADPNDWTYGPIVPPIYPTTTFKVGEPGKAVYDYSRCDNPTRTELQKTLASLESTEYALVFSSGLGAITPFAFLIGTGKHILSCDDVYGGTFRLMSRCFNNLGIETTYVDGVKLSNWTDNFRVGQTKLVWVETPSNPTMKVIDIKAVVDAVKKLDKECIVVVDNTFITSVYQSPIKLGADIVMHSCSKYMGGHSDIIMGALMLNNKDLYDRFKFFQNSLGIVPGTHDCHLMLRSVKTLEIRVRQQTANAMRIAEWLEAHDKVEKVLYPGLKSHPQHELAARQCTGFGAMLSVYIKAPKGDEPFKFVRAVKLFHCAESLGCVTSLIEIPAFMTHSSVPKDNRMKLGITDNMLRVSIGIENVEDLIGDLDNAFKQVYN